MHKQVPADYRLELVLSSFPTAHAIAPLYSPREVLLVQRTHLALQFYFSSTTLCYCLLVELLSVITLTVNFLPRSRIALDRRPGL